MAKLEKNKDGITQNCENCFRDIAASELRLVISATEEDVFLCNICLQKKCGELITTKRLKE